MPLSLDEIQLGDVYENKEGKRFIVSVLCREPTVHMTEIGPDMDSNPRNIMAGISGKMWDGFQKLSRQ